MTGETPAIVDAVVNTLKAASAVTAIVSSRVHKALPTRPSYPCVSVFVPSGLPWDTKDAQGSEATVQVDCWTRDDRDGDTVRDLQKAVHGALHESPLTLSTGSHVLTRLIVELVMDDPDDAVTLHGVQQFRVLAHG